MENQQEFVSAFPPPPSYYKLYDPNLNTPPEKLKPPKPIEGQFVMFGQLVSVRFSH